MAMNCPNNSRILSLAWIWNLNKLILIKEENIKLLTPIKFKGGRKKKLWKVSHQHDNNKKITKMDFRKSYFRVLAY